ncbi:MAG: hypothetical protein RJA49_167 [Actinomycetota bacterium]|jgi:photosystem II stability/assembly factor-like uncharacterized protein
MSDPLDHDLAQLRDRLQADAARNADSMNTLAAVKDGTVVGLAPQPPSRRNGRVVAAVAAAGLVAASVIAIALSRGDGDADIVPVTEPTTGVTTATTTATSLPVAPTVPSTTATLPTPTTAVPTTLAPIALSLDYIAQVRFLDPTHGWLLGQPTGTSGLALYATVNGANWTEVTTPEPLLGLEFADAQNGWMIGLAHVWSTHDGGATFTQVGALIGGLDGNPPPIFVHDGFVYTLGYIATSDPGFRVFRSPVDHDDFSDTGVSFGQGAGPVADFSFAATGNSVFVVYNDRTVTGAGRIVNGTADTTWRPPAADQGGAVRLTSSGTGPIYSFGQVGTWGGPALANKAFVSHDGGDTFRPITLPPNEPNDGLTLAAIDEHTVMASTSKGVYASTDEGTTWTLRSNPPSTAAVTFQTPPIASAVVNDGTSTQLWTSTDGGWSWTRTLG